MVHHRLIVLVRGMVGHFLQISHAPDQEEAQRLRLMTNSHLDDGEFARLLYDKIGGLIGPAFTASLGAGDSGGGRFAGGARSAEPVLVCASYRADDGADPATRVACLAYASATDLERQICEFILRGIALTEPAIAAHLDRELSPDFGLPVTAESA